MLMLKHRRTNKNTFNCRNRKTDGDIDRGRGIYSTELLTAAATLMSHHWKVRCKQVNNNLNDKHNKHPGVWMLPRGGSDPDFSSSLMIHWKAHWILEEERGRNWMNNLSIIVVVINEKKWIFILFYCWTFWRIEKDTSLSYCLIGTSI